MYSSINPLSHIINVCMCLRGGNPSSHDLHSFPCNISGRIPNMSEKPMILAALGPCESVLPIYGQWRHE